MTGDRAVRARVVLGVSGGIAAFRAVELLRILIKTGCSVKVIMTDNATRFVSPRTFAVLSNSEAQVSLWDDEGRPSIDHIDLARRADLLLVAPATANVLAKMAAGIADDALSTYALAHRRGVLVAPSMNTFMWRNPATQEALSKLRSRGVAVVEPDAGVLACGEVGEGRFPAVETIATTALKMVPARGPMAGLRVLVTAGGTREAIDAVRVITNRSSGRMGTALAREAARLGARVTFLAGPGVGTVGEATNRRFESANDLEALLAEHAPGVDLVLHAAAVADFRPSATTVGKLDRRQGALELGLEPVQDLAAGLPRDDRGGPFLVIFAAEAAADLESRAAAKLRAKRAQAVIANPIDEAGLGMETEDNRAVLLAGSGERWEFPPQTKDALARELLLALTPHVLAAVP